MELRATLKKVSIRHPCFKHVLFLFRHVLLFKYNVKGLPNLTFMFNDTRSTVCYISLLIMNTHTKQFPYVRHHNGSLYSKNIDIDASQKNRATLNIARVIATQAQIGIRKMFHATS